MTPEQQWQIEDLKERYTCGEMSYEVYEETVMMTLVSPMTLMKTIRSGIPFWYILQDGKPVPEWDMRVSDAFLGNVADRIVEQTTLLAPDGAEVFISTVFMGYDAGHGRGKPVLWETMIFWEDHELDRWQHRYTSEEEARWGHQEALDLVKKALHA